MNTYKKYISLNIRYLCEQFKLTQNEFGELFELGRSVVSHYIAQKTTPKTETIIQICDHFDLNIDDFLRRDISTVATKSVSTVEEPSGSYNNCKQCADKERIIEVLERENATLQQTIAILQDRNSSAANQTA